MCFRYKEDVKRLKAKLDSKEHELLLLRNDNKDKLSQSNHNQVDQAIQNVPMSKEIAVNTLEIGIQLFEKDLTVTSGHIDVDAPFKFSPTKISEQSDSIDSGLHNPPSVNFGEVGDDQISRFLNDAVSSLAVTDHNNMIKLRMDEALKTIEVERR